ncbi:MAG: FAD-binding oxidoreductase, partial [Bacteroidales bacterium]
MIQVLAKYIDGEVFDSNVYRRLFSTDASPYLELPLGVVFPKHKADIKEVINFAGKNKISLIFRGAGTSLAGQVVGKGLIVDTSKYMTEILEVNTDEQWVRVQPGVVRDKLNQYLKPLGFQFGPETS